MPAPISLPTITNFDLDALAAGTNGTASFSEGGSAVLLAPNAVLAATGSFAGQNLTISGLLAEDEIGFGAGVTISGHNIKIAGTKIGSFTSGSGESLVINFTDGASAASVQTLIRNLTFSDSSHNPAINQLLTFNLAGTVRTDAVSVAALNEAPVIDAKGSAKYVENDPATTILSKLSISDSDSATLMGAKVSITGNFAAGQDVLGFVNQNGISGSYNASTGVLTLSGSSSLANYKAALQSVTYSNSSDNPSTATRTISFQVDDGVALNHASNIATASVKVVDVNDAPVPDLNGAAAGTSAYAYYYVGNPLTKIAPNATVFDADSANFDGGRLRVDFSQNGSAGDRLAVVTDAVVTVTGGIVAINGTAIGTVFGGSNGSPLIVLFNGDATQERVAVLMEHIGYANTRPSPSTLDRTVTFTLRDGDGHDHGGDSSGTAQATIHLGTGSIVVAPDTAPGSGSGSEDTTIAVSLSGSDTDGWVTSFRITSLPANGTLYSDAGATIAIALNGTVAASGNAAMVYFKPNPNYNGAASFQYASIDNGGTQDPTPATASLNVVAVNDVPVANADTLAATEDTAVTYTAAQLLANDTDADGNPLTIASVTSGTGGTAVLNGDGTVTFTPNANFNGAANFTYKATDGTAQSNGATVTVNVAAVNDAPVANADTLAATEDTAVTYTAAQLLANDTDADGNPLTIASVTSGTGGTAVLNGDGTVTFTPNANFNGAANFSYKATDGTAQSNSATVTVNVAAVNDAPVANADTLAATEDTAVTYTAAQLLGNDTDADGNALTIASVTSGTGGTAVLNGDGTVTFTPNANFNGAANFTYKATDGTAQSNSATVTVNVTAVNDAPVANGDTLAATEDTAVTYTAAQLLANDTDADGNPLTLASVTGGTGGTAVLNGDGTVTFTPNANFNGAANFTYKATDGTAQSNSATVTVNVAAVNDAPVANGDTLAATEDTAATYTAAQLLGNDTDADGNPLTIASVTSGTGGTAVLNGDGTVTFTPNANFNGAANFTYKATDGTAQSNSATVTVNVAAVNDAPVANGDTLAATEDTAATYTAAQLLGNDTDADGNPLTIASVTSGTGGTAVLNGDGTVTFTPNANFNGTANFTYKATDGTAQSNSATVTVNVAAVNDAPVANADTLAATEDTAVTYTAAQLLSNDTDVDGNPLTIASVSSGTGGTAVLNGDGTVTFTPNANFNGAANFTYKATDGTAQSNSATATVNVAPVNDAPTTDNVLVNTNQNTAIAGHLGAADVDAGDTLAFSVETGPAHGTLSLAANGDYLYTPNAGYAGGDAFTFKVTDSGGLFATGSADVTVAATSAQVRYLSVGGGGGGVDDTVNTNSGEGISTPEAAALSGGGHVVVWSTYLQSPDSSGNGVFGQMYDGAGAKVGTEFLVNTYIADEQFDPSVTGLADGGFIVTWESYRQSPDLFSYGTVGQRFDASGAKVGGEFQVNQTFPGDQMSSTVSTLANGNFVVTWYSSSGEDIYARVFHPDAGGVTAVTGEFVVNTNISGYQDSLGWDAQTVVGLTGGRFAVVWTDYNGQDGSGAGVFARVFEANGTAVNVAQVPVNTTTAGDQSYGSVGALNDGGFVVTWTSADSDQGGIFAQRFDASGSAVGTEFAVNSFTSGDQFGPKVSALSDGGFVVAWMTYGPHGTTNSIDGQRYDAAGNAVGGEFTINASDLGNDAYPSLALRSDGALVATWLADYNTVEQKIITSFEIGGVAKDLLGGAGNDSFLGSALADTLNGAGGNDRLEGLGGNDTLTGGSGADAFVFGLPAHGVDSVMDFVSGADWLGISATGFGGGLVAGGAATLVSAADAASAFHIGSGGYFIFDDAGPGTGTVYWDPTGGSGADAVAFVQLVGVASLQASDLHLL